MNDPKELLLKYFDVGVLVIVALAVVYAAFSVFQSDPETQAQASTIEQNAATLKTNTDRQGETWDPEASSLDLASVLGAQIQVKRVPPGESWPAWSLDRRPYLLTAFKGPPPDLIPKHEAPGNVTATAARGQVAVRWTESIQNKYVLVKGYEVQRKDAEAGEWNVVGRATASDTEYVDKDVKAQSDYWYKIVSVAEVDRNHPRIRTFKGEVKLEDDDKIKQSEEAGPAETPRDVYLIPKFAQIPDPVKQPDGTKKAFVKVYKWDSDTNDWIKPKQFPVEIGQPIGEIQKAIGSQPAIDRRTGAKLLDCGQDEVEEKIAGGTAVKRTYYWIEVEFEDGTKARFDNLKIPEEIKDVK